MGKTLGYGEITVANMTEPFTVMLTNEAQQFATDSNRKVTFAQSYYTDIIVIRGSQERTDYTIGNITSGSGITVSKNSKRVTFSVSAGSVIGADTGVIEIPITLDGQTVKKQFSWSCGKQGPQGVKGENGSKGKSVQNVIEYYLATSASSNVTSSTNGWSTDPTTQKLTAEKKYLWNCKQTVYDDGTKGSITSPVICGTYGETGKNALQSNRTYTGTYTTVGETAYASTSSFNRTPIVGDIYTCLDGSSNTGTWQVTAISGTSVTVKLLGYVKSKGEDGKNGADGDSFAWNMLSETNCGKKHWGTESSGGKYSVEDFITEDNIDAVKLICTEAISTSNWSYVSFKDIKMLKQLKPSTKYTLSYDIKANRSGAISHSICKGDVSNFCTNTVVVNNIIGNETWQHISVVLTTNDLKTTPTNEILYLGRNALSKVGYSIIKNLKLVEGDIDTPWSPSQSDIEGKGVVETVQYYLVTSQASGVTSSTSGWSTDITTQKLTTDKKYLWNCYQTKYSDGTSEPISTPKVIGVYGDKGQKGDNAKNLSITPSSQYFKSTDGGKTFAPNTITIKPTIQGEINFGKWQYSIDGGVSFADVVSGQKGLTISNNVLSISKDSSLYSDAVTMVTFRAVADDSSFYDTCSIAKIYDVSDIGDGRNLLWNSNFAKTDEAITGTTNSWGLHTRGTNLVASIDTSTKHNGFNTLKTVSAANGDKNSSNDLEWFAWGISERTSDNLHSKNQNYTLSFYAKASVTTDFIVRWGYDAYGADTTRTLTTNWQKYEIKLHQATSAYSITIIFKLLTAGTVWFSEFKLEKGSSATGYSTAPEDLQTAILSTKSEISDVSLKVDKNKQAIEQRVEKTTYQQDLKLVKGDISKANEGLNKWRYEIYPKSLFTSEYQGKSTMDVFAKNTNLTPSQSVLINDTDFGKNWAYGDNYIGYALTFVKFSAAKSVAITFKHDDGAHLYLNGKLIGGDDTCNTGSGESLTLSFIQGWNCLEVVLNEKSGGEYIGLGTTISAISECQLMNCYYGTPVARQSHITNQLVQNTTDIDGVSGSVQKVMSTVGGSGKIDEFVSNYATWKKKVDGIETRVGETYTTKDDFDDLQIGGRNLLKHSSMIGEKLICDNYFICNNCNIQEYTNDGFHIITPTEGNANNGIAFAFDNFTIMEINGGDTITFSCDIKGTSDSHAPFVSIHISDNNWYGSGVVQKNTNVSITKDWQRVSVTITTPTGLTKNHMWLAIHGNHQSDLYVRNFKLEKGNKPTDWTPAPEDVNGKIVNVETIANQTANKFSWIVKSGTSASNFEITDKFMNLVSTNINLDGIVSFMNTAKGDGRKNLYNLDYSSFENVASQEDAICYAKDNGVTSVGIDSSVSYDGDKSLKISYTTANLNSSTTPLYLGSSTNNYGCVKIQAGKQYILSCYVKSDSTTGMFMIDIQGHDTPDTKTNGLYLSNIDPRKLPGSSTGVNLSTDWQRAVCAIKVADNATGLYWSVVPLIWGKPSSSNVPQTFNVWVDCIMLEEVDSISNEPGTYILDKETIIDGGSVKADTITGNQILAGSITADKIATDAIKSHNYISSGGTQGSFLNLGDGSFTSPNLSWDSNGNLIAKNANIIGNLTAGTVGEWKIDKYIYSRDKMFFDINKHNGQSIYNKNSTNNLFLGDGKVSSFYWFTTQNNTFIIENGNSPQYATGPAGISFGTNIAQGQIELYESVYPGNIIQDYEQTSHTSELSISGSKISFSYYDSNGSSFSDSPYTYIMADYARFYGDIFVQGSITTDEGVDVGGKLQASSIATKNGGLIETAGTVYGGGEIQCGGGQMRIIGGNYGILLRNDGSDFYILSTDSGSPWGSWNSKRPFRINLANGIPYFEYGIIIPNENYLLGNGYQLARGTSWGGVCIGDDSKRLRLYGTSIWASHSISTSDENLKENFTTLDQYEEFYMNLNPIGFNYIGDYDGKKTHFGFGAHKIEDILESEGYDADKFAVVTHRPLVQEDIEKRFGKDVTVDIETEYGVSYAEFIALNTHMIQKTRRELTKVKQEKADLEARLQIIEAKLGL